MKNQGYHHVMPRYIISHKNYSSMGSYMNACSASLAAIIDVVCCHGIHDTCTMKCHAAL